MREKWQERDYRTEAGQRLDRGWTEVGHRLAGHRLVGWTGTVQMDGYQTESGHRLVG